MLDVSDVRAYRLRTYRIGKFNFIFVSQFFQKRLQFLEQMCQIGKNSESSLLPDTTLKIDSTVNTIDCTDPIRRDASISVRSLSPYKVVSSDSSYHFANKKTIF